MYEIDEREYGEFMIMVGRTSGPTWGTYNAIKSVKFVDEIYRDEDGTPRSVECHDHLIISPPSEPISISDPGDSGAFVFSTLGLLIGMVIGGCPGSNSVRFTSVKDLFDDIFKVTGAKEICLPPL